jgi:hypothetical protein
MFISSLSSFRLSCHNHFATHGESFWYMLIDGAMDYLVDRYIPERSRLNLHPSLYAGSQRWPQKQELCTSDTCLEPTVVHVMQFPGA